jgi:hypothetical protein
MDNPDLLLLHEWLWREVSIRATYLWEYPGTVFTRQAPLRHLQESKLPCMLPRGGPMPEHIQRRPRMGRVVWLLLGSSIPAAWALPSQKFVVETAVRAFVFLTGCYGRRSWNLWLLGLESSRIFSCVRDRCGFGRCRACRLAYHESGPYLGKIDQILPGIRSC